MNELVQCAAAGVFMISFLFAQIPHLCVMQPDGQTVDKKVNIVVKGLAPFQEAELNAEAEDQKGDVWSSHARFQADQLGIIEVATSPPLLGSSYASSNSMGLFWSMLPASGDMLSSYKCKDDAFVSQIRLLVDGNFVDQVKVTQYLKTPDVQRIDVREDGLVGALFVPKSDMPVPVVITLSGSSGGLSENRAKLLASNGFAVFALGYFAVEGLTDQLQEIPLEYFEKAFAWLKKQPNLNGSRVGLYGVSRGGELALILGSLFPDSVQAIVAAVPSSVVYGGLGETPIDAWLYQGKPMIPFAPVPKIEVSKGKTADNPASTRDNFLEGMKEEAAFAAAAIPVEKIRSPLLLISGGDDQMWPSEIYVTQIVNRLKAKGSQIKVLHLNYPNAGHGINIPHLPESGTTYYHPVGKLWFSMGGSRASNAEASTDAWKQLVAFFHENLSN
jgi:dienelactone hydrolase